MMGDVRWLILYYSCGSDFFHWLCETDSRTGRQTAAQGRRGVSSVRAEDYFAARGPDSPQLIGVASLTWAPFFPICSN